MSLGAIARALNLSKSTVPYVVKQFKDRTSVTTKMKKGRPPKLSKRFAHISDQFSNQFTPTLCCRYMRNLLRLSWQHPFWGAGRLVEHTHANILAAIANIPPGLAIIRVSSCQ